uniref:Uncharacterized protein n=1 Tax=Weissella thailandensis fsh4-2 TaxID=1056112 RepID=G0UEG4_9LACO|nr:putative uncharacterized protein [Weissella thailandensis fsh4-2]
MKIGKNVTPRLVNDKEHVEVKLVSLEPHTETGSFGEVAWRAYILELVPNDTTIRPFKTRMYLADHEDATFENIGDKFLAIIQRFNEFAAEKYNRLEYDTDDLIGATFVVEVTYNKSGTLPYINLVKINEMPALENHGGQGLGFGVDNHE